MCRIYIFLFLLSHCTVSIFLDKRLINKKYTIDSLDKDLFYTYCSSQDKPNQNLPINLLFPTINIEIVKEPPPKDILIPLGVVNFLFRFDKQIATKHSIKIKISDQNIVEQIRVTSLYIILDNNRFPLFSNNIFILKPSYSRNGITKGDTTEVFKCKKENIEFFDSKHFICKNKLDYYDYYETVEPLIISRLCEECIKKAKTIFLETNYEAMSGNVRYFKKIIQPLRYQKCTLGITFGLAYGFEVLSF